MVTLILQGSYMLMLNKVRHQLNKVIQLYTDWQYCILTGICTFLVPECKNINLIFKEVEIAIKIFLKYFGLTFKEKHTKYLGPFLESLKIKISNLEPNYFCIKQVIISPVIISEIKNFLKCYSLLLILFLLSPFNVLFFNDTINWTFNLWNSLPCNRRWLISRETISNSNVRFVLRTLLNLLTFCDFPLTLPSFNALVWWWNNLSWNAWGILPRVLNEMRTVAATF